MAIAIDVRDCAPRRRGFGGGFKGPGVPAGAGPPSPERSCAGPQPSCGMPRIQQVRRIGRQEADRIARNVRALFEWTFVALADAASLLGRGSPFRGKLEAVGVGENFFGACGLWRFEQRIQPFLSDSWRRRLACPDASGAGVFAMCGDQKNRRRDAGATKIRSPTNPRRPIPEKRDRDRQWGRSGVPSGKSAS